MTSTPVIDLKYFQPVRHRSGHTRKEMTYVHWKVNIFASLGFHANAYISPLRCSLSRRPQCPKLHMSGSISLYGLCSTDIPGEPSRYRSLSPCTTAKVVSHGHSRHRSKVQSRRCQRTAVLAYICRPCPFVNHHSPNTLQRRAIRDRFGANCICIGCHHHRSVPLDVSMGYVPAEQGSNQTAYPSGPPGQYSNIYLHLRWHRARCEYPRCTSNRARRLLCNGSRLSGLRQTQRHISISRFLCNSLKIQSQMSKNLFSSDRSHNGSPVRSDNYADGILFAQGLSKQTETYKVLRCRHQQNSGFSDQQFRPASTYYRTALPLPMAGRTFLQVDQAKPAHQEFLRHFRECCQNSNLDRYLSIRLGRHTQKAAQYPDKSLHNSTNIERHGFRKNSAVRAIYGNNPGRGNLRFPKPAEFIHLTVGR